MSTPRTGAERYFNERLADPEYRSAYEAEKERISASGFYEDDEPIEDVLAAWNAGTGGITQPARSPSA